MNPEVVFVSQDQRTRIVKHPLDVPIDSLFGSMASNHYVIEHASGADSLGQPQWHTVGTETPSRCIFDVILELLARVERLESFGKREECS